jgi:Uma2 family endonuclease
MLIQETLYSAEEFFHIAQLPENATRQLELEDGVIVEMPSSSKLNTVTALRIATFINSYVMSHNLGVVSGADGGYRLSPTRVRQPDVGFVSQKHSIDLKDGVVFEIPPDLAVEVVSPTEDVFKKANEYLAAGTRLVWAVYTEDKTVYAMRLDERGRLSSQGHSIDDTLLGEDVLPGFSLPVRDIFP